MRALLVAVWVAAVAGIVASIVASQVPVKETDTGRLQGRVIDERGEPKYYARQIVLQGEELQIPRQEPARLRRRGVRR